MAKQDTKNKTRKRRPNEVVIDARAHMLGRLASVVAKQALAGNHISIVRCEEINVSGGIVRQKMKYERFLRKGTRTNPRHGQFHFRAPSAILKRTIRGMVPHKTVRGQKAMERVQTFEGMPPPFDKQKRMVVPQCLKPVCLQHGHRYCRLGDLSTQVGWKHEKAVAMLEDKRKVKAQKYYEQKKKLIALRNKAEQQVKVAA